MEKLKNIDELYSDYYIKKRKNKYRHIQAPNENLKQKQYNVLRQLENLNLPIHECAYGFVKDKSIADNARIHVGQECILNLDLKDFFDTFETKTVYHYLKNKGIKNSKYISQVLTRNGRVVQGAPTSPYITNLLFLRHDKKLFKIANDNNLLYSRYADDMSFSGKFKDIKKCKKEIFNYILESGFKISWEKVELQFATQRQKVTGIVVNEKPNIQYEKANHIRALCHCIERDVNNKTIKTVEDIEKLYGTKYEALYGYVNFMSDVNSKFEKYKKQLYNAYKKIKKN